MADECLLLPEADLHSLRLSALPMTAHGTPAPFPHQFISTRFQLGKSRRHRAFRLLCLRFALLL
ncbi:MAG: hypothetical protein Q8N54_13370, partial [Sulfurimicrobium sp.]|nr:hypothetical protein [Sulfurimicrobium sp.]